MHDITSSWTGLRDHGANFAYWLKPRIDRIRVCITRKLAWTFHNLTSPAVPTRLDHMIPRIVPNINAPISNTGGSYLVHITLSWEILLPPSHPSQKSRHDTRQILGGLIHTFRLAKPNLWHLSPIYYCPNFNLGAVPKHWPGYFPSPRYKNRLLPAHAPSYTTNCDIRAPSHVSPDRLYRLHVPS